MSAHRAYIGIGSNLGDRLGNVEEAIECLTKLGRVDRRSSYYRTRPWGKPDQPWFLNAVVRLLTQAAPTELLRQLHAIENGLGRERGVRWGPRTIDLDLLLYDDLNIVDTEIAIPHPHLRERAFVVVPLSEIDVTFEPLRATLDASELAGVVRVEREALIAMREKSLSASERVRALARFLSEGEVVRVRIVRDDEEIEVSAPPQFRAAVQSHERDGEKPAQRVDTIKADLVGIFRLSRPAPTQGDVLDADRELGYIEALGIRTPVHSMGPGRLVSVETPDGSPVEYGQPLFLVARGR